LAKLNPRLVYASISGFGQDGPYRDRPGFDQIAQGMGGIMSVTGEPGRGPMRAGIPIADLSAGLFAALGILTALLEREVSGKGQAVATSLLQAQTFMLDFQGARYLNEKEVPGQAGNNHPTSIPTGVFKCQDSYINIAASGQAIWQRFAAAVGGEAWVQMPAFKTGRDRSVNRDALNAAIAARMRHRTVAAWVDILNAAGVPCGSINSIDAVFNDPQVQHLQLAQTVESGDARGTVTVIGQPVTMSRTPSRIVQAPPERGQHTGAILKEFGFSKTEIATLKRTGVV
jgi:crotonobetainyl-CoA:carnitine CoA-transferase CaiB-like acyl-CoA transferase